MPAINVAKTDTFEIQRQKINQIGNQIFNISQGGSDLATGNLKLGDGTRTAPSLAFTSDSSLGIFKSETSALSYVASGKKLSTFSSSAVYSFRDFIVQKNVLNPSEISLISSGSNYDPGTYDDVPVVGGSGEFATLNVVVTSYTGTFTNIGQNYTVGTYTGIPIIGGSGSGAIATFNVDGIEGFISQTGSSYNPGVYSNVPITGGSGSGAEATIEITGDANIVGSISNSGSGYAEGAYSAVSVYNAPTQTFTLTSVSNPGTPPPDNVYSVNGNIQQQLTLVIGNTYRFDVSDSSMQGHPLIFQTSGGQILSADDYVVVESGISGEANSFVDIVIKPSASTGTIKYNCASHDGMGADINIITGSSGNYGTFAIANVVVNSSGSVSEIVFSSNGSDYKSGDVLVLSPTNLGNSGSGFEFTISSINYTGIVSSVTFTDNGSGYLIDDVLSASDSDLGGVGGSGFQYVVDNNPRSIEDFTFTQKGSGYQLNDVLTLPQTVSGVSAVIPGTVSNISTTVSTATAVINVPSTTNISVGMTVIGDRLNDVGSVADNTTVQSVDSPTQITLSSIPTLDGAVTLTFTSPGNLNIISLPSVNGIVVGSTISVTSGVASLDPNTTVDSVDNNTNEIVLSQQSTLPGSAVLEFVPPYGDPLINDFEFTIDALGPVETFSVTNPGNGYSVGDQLGVSPSDLAQPFTIVVTNKNISKVTFVDTLPDSTFSVGDILTKKGGTISVILQPSAPPAITPTVVSSISTTLSDASAVITVASTTGIVAGMDITVDAGSTGDLSPGTKVQSVDSSTQITLDQIPRTAGSATLTFTSDESGSFVGVSSTTSGSGTGATFDVVRNSDGTIASVSVNNGGYFYDNVDTITISGSDIGGTTPTHDLTFDISSVISYPNIVVRKVNSSGGNIDSILVDYDSILNGDFILVSGTNTPEYEVDTASGSPIYRYFLDDGSGSVITPDITLYVGNTYTFDLSDSSNNGHVFSLSKFRDGIWGPSFIEDVSSTLLTTSRDITVTNSTGILPGMEVTSTSGIGQVLSGTTVESVNGNTITLSSNPVSSGAVVLTFRGVEYTDNVSRTQTTLTIKVTDTTPNLYYYCGTSDPSHSDEGGEDNEESLFTIDPNNPKVFGSGFQISVLGLSSQDLITADVDTGDLTAQKLISDDAEIDTVVVGTDISSPNISGTTLSIQTINSSGLVVNSATTSISGNLSVGNNIQLESSNGNITTSGELKTLGTLNVNDYINIDDNVISSTAGHNIILTPSTGRVAKVNTNTAFIVPSGNSAERPTTGIVENGAIRFNTDNNQYEGYTQATSSWSSLGGVRDIDGNTYILAELTAGANDNTLWFYNDNNNTLKLTTQFLDFRSVKKISSGKLGLPSFTLWTANTPVNIGQYLKYRNNLYEVTAAGTTAPSGSEPSHTSGVANSGTAQLTWYSSAVSPLEFTEVEELRVGPNKDCPLIINSETKVFNNTISTLVEDLVLAPNSGKKVVVACSTSLVVPVGNTNQRESASQGSIRYNTTISQFEGYSGSNWSSLGGVRDVDGNTYIIPETAPAANENILYFYNDGTNTLKLTATELDFTNIDTITTSGGNSLAINTDIVTLDNSATTIDNTDATRTFISTTKQYLDLGLSSGLNVDPVLRLDDQGDVYLNTGFGTGTFAGIKIFDSDLKDFELADYLVKTSVISLVKGVSNSGATILYNTAAAKGCRVTVVSKSSTGKKSMVEYNVIDNGTDIFHNEFGSLNTSADGFEASFDITPGNETRITLTLSDDHATNDTVEITVLTQVVK